MRLQLDLRIEAANLTKFRKYFKTRTNASFPYPFHAFTTRSVMIEEFAQGLPLAYFLQNGGGPPQGHISVGDAWLDGRLSTLTTLNDLST